MYSIFVEIIEIYFNKYRDEYHVKVFIVRIDEIAKFAICKKASLRRFVSLKDAFSLQF